MRSRTKTKLLVTLLCLLFSMFMMSAISLAGTTALATTNFSNLEITGAGMYLKTTEEGALRFNVRVTAAEHKEIDGDDARSGMLIIPSDILGNSELTVNFSKEIGGETVVPRNKILDGYWTAEGETHYNSYVYLYGIPAASYARNITARAYVIVEGQSQPYYSEPVERCIASVAVSAAQDPEYADHLTLINSYRPKYTVNFYDGQDLVETVSDVMYGESVEYAIEDSVDGAYVVKNTGWVDGEGNDVSLDYVTGDMNVYAKSERLLMVDEVFDVELASGGQLNLNNELTDFADLNSPKAYLETESGYVQSSKLSLADGVLTFTKESEEDLGEQSVIVSDGTNGYTFDVTVITKIITTAAELDAIYAGYGNNPIEDNNYSYGGYFVLGNNIDATGVRIWEKLPGSYNNAGAIDPIYANTYGFTGTLDGRGYVVSNISTVGTSPSGTYANSSYGIFGNIATTGVVKNVAFTNVQCGTSVVQHTILANYMAGTIENVYVETIGAFTSTFRQTFVNVSAISNLIIYAPNTSNATVGTFYGNNQSESSYVNTVIVSSNERNEYKGCYAFAQSTYKENENFTNYDFEGKFTSDIWTASNGTLPYFDTMAEDKEITGTTDSTITLAINNGETTTLAQSYEGVTLEGGTLNIASTCQVSHVIINVSNPVHNFTYDVNVYIPITKTLGSDALYDTYGTTGLSIDLSSQSVTAIDSFKIGETVVDAGKYTFAEGVLTMTRDNFESLNLEIGDYGFEIVSGDVTYVQTLKVVTKIITTPDELDAIYAGYGNNPTEDNNYSYGGYFVLGKNIDATDIRIWEKLPGSYTTADPMATANDYGFTGTFDGRGYVVSNINTAGTSANGLYPSVSYGIFGNIATTGVVKNVAFTNVQVGVSGVTMVLLGNYMAGTVKNVYIETSAVFHTVFRQAFKDVANVSDMVVYAPNMIYGIIGTMPNGNWSYVPSFDNVVVVSKATEEIRNGCYIFNYETYKDSETFKAYDFEGKFTSDVWKFVDGDLPVFSKMDLE